MDINAYKFVFRRSETSRKIYIKIHANNTTDIYSVHVCSLRRLFFFRETHVILTVTHKIYNLTPDFKSKLFKCNNHILIKSSANKRSLNQLIGPAWNQTRFGRDELIIFCTQFLDTDLPFEWYLYFIYHVAKILIQ